MSVWEGIRQLINLKLTLSCIVLLYCVSFILSDHWWPAANTFMSTVLLFFFCSVMSVKKQMNVWSHPLPQRMNILHCWLNPILPRAAEGCHTPPSEDSSSTLAGHLHCAAVHDITGNTKIHILLDTNIQTYACKRIYTTKPVKQKRTHAYLHTKHACKQTCTYTYNHTQINTHIRTHAKNCTNTNTHTYTYAHGDTNT